MKIMINTTHKAVCLGALDVRKVLVDECVACGRRRSPECPEGPFIFVPMFIDGACPNKTPAKSRRTAGDLDVYIEPLKGATPEPHIKAKVRQG